MSEKLNQSQEIATKDWQRWLSDINFIEGNQGRDSGTCVRRVAAGQKPAGIIEGQQDIELARQLGLTFEGDSSGGFIYLYPERLFGDIFPQEAIDKAKAAYEPIIPGISVHLEYIYAHFLKMNRLRGLQTNYPYQTDEQWGSVKNCELAAYHAINGLLLGYPIEEGEHATTKYLERNKSYFVD